MSNIWDNAENEEFRDVPDEVSLDGNGQQMQSAPVRVPVKNSQPQAPQPYRPSNIPAEPIARPNGRDLSVGPTLADLDLDELVQDDDDFTEVLNDANLRIEQGRLYQMIMNHNLFEGMDADPRAVQNVQSGIRKFARESMEVMLGMREATPTNAFAPSPFNDLEVDILKKLASKATGGATESPEANQVAHTLKETPKRKTLNPIGGSSKMSPTKSQPQKQGQKLQSQPSAPIKRAKLDATIDQICEEEGIPRELLEENYRPLGKSMSELSSEEAIKRAKETAQRLSLRTTVKSRDAIPMATLQQEEMLAMSRAQQVASGPGMAAILAKVNSMPIKNK